MSKKTPPKGGPTPDSGGRGRPSFASPTRDDRRPSHDFTPEVWARIRHEVAQAPPLTQARLDRLARAIWPDGSHRIVREPATDE